MHSEPSKAAVARDSARYRWLRDHSCPPHNFYIAVPDEFAGVRYRPDEVDAYIDAAAGRLHHHQGTHAMSETDKYAQLIDFVGEDTNIEAYLREHFVTREEYEALSTTVRLHVAEARLWSTKAREWKAELATLTAERDRLRAALKKISNYHKESSAKISLIADHFVDLADQAMENKNV